MSNFLLREIEAWYDEWVPRILDIYTYEPDLRVKAIKALLDRLHLAWEQEHKFLADRLYEEDRINEQLRVEREALRDDVRALADALHLLLVDIRLVAGDEPRERRVPAQHTVAGILQAYDTLARSGGRQVMEEK